MKSMSRKKARLHSFALIYLYEFHKDEDKVCIFDKYVDSVSTMEDDDVTAIKRADRPFIENEFYGVFRYFSKIDEIISSNLVGWTIGRLSKMDLAILRLAIYEIFYDDEIPNSVSVNEAVNLSKIYGTDDSPKFINGVLGTVLKQELSIEIEEVEENIEIENENENGENE